MGLFFIIIEKEGSKFSIFNLLEKTGLCFLIAHYGLFIEIKVKKIPRLRDFF